MHPEMHRKDLLDAPIGHWVDDKHGAGRNFVFPLSLSLHGGSHLPDCDPARGFDAALNHVSRRVRLQVLCGVIWLLRPLVLNEFDATPVGDHQVAATFADDDHGRPARMSFHSEGDFHLSPEGGMLRLSLETFDARSQPVLIPVSKRIYALSIVARFILIRVVDVRRHTEGYPPIDVGIKKPHLSAKRTIRNNAGRNPAPVIGE